MSHSEYRKSNDTTQYLVVHAEDYLPTPCNNMGNNNLERSFSVSPPSNPIEEGDQRGEMSTPESDVQESPLDFSLPKRSKSTASMYEAKIPYATSSLPPLNMCSQRRSPPELGSKIPQDPYPTRPGSNGSKTSRNPYLAHHHHNNGSNIEMFANGPCVSSDAGQGRSQSFSPSVGKIRKHGIRPHSRGMPSGSGVGPLSTHHLNDPALIQNVTPAVTYANLVPQALPPSTSPSVTCIPNMVPNDVLDYCNDRRTKSTSDNCHYTFLTAGVPSCINSNFCRNGMLTAHPNVLPSSVHSSSSIHPSMQIGNVPSATPISHPSKSTVIVKSTSPTPTVTTSATSTTAKRRPRSLPDDQKDEAYWERRRKNNEAAKRSRDARRQKEEEVAMRASFLEQENIKLQTEVATLQTETEQLRVLLYEK